MLGVSGPGMEQACFQCYCFAALLRVLSSNNPVDARVG